MDIRIDNSTAIVFDLDDTLYNEIEYLKSAYAHIASHLDQKNWKPLFRKNFKLQKKLIHKTVPAKLKHKYI